MKGLVTSVLMKVRKDFDRSNQGRITLKRRLHWDIDAQKNIHHVTKQFKLMTECMYLVFNKRTRCQPLILLPSDMSWLKALNPVAVLEKV